MIEVIPAVIPPNLNVVRETFSKVLGLCKKVQMDVVDGHYAPVTTWPFGPGQMEELLQMVRGEERFPFINEFEFELDMMMLHPIELISDFIGIGFKSFVIHIDSTDHVSECLETIKSAGCNAGLGIKPSVSTDLLRPCLSQVQFVQFMGNDRIGHNGVELDPSVLQKIHNFHEEHPSMELQIDIGVNFETAKSLIDAGITRLISGSAVFNGDNIKENLSRLANS